jgi:hypothetical protein
LLAGELSANGNCIRGTLRALTIANGPAFDLGHGRPGGNVALLGSMERWRSRIRQLHGRYRAHWNSTLARSNDIDLKDINVNLAISAKTSATDDSVVELSYWIIALPSRCRQRVASLRQRRRLFSMPETAMRQRAVYGALGLYIFKAV